MPHGIGSHGQVHPATARGGLLDRAAGSECNGCMIVDAALILAGYLAGSVACAIIVCRLLGLPDPRHGGSGNPGATNVLRLGGRKAALLTLAGKRFIEGEPMKPATNMLAGLS